MKRVLIVTTIIAALSAGACGKSTPATPSPTVSSLSLSPATDYVKLKATEKFSVSATYNTGSSETVAAAWSSDNQAVATVDASGTVAGVGAGQATITATYQGKTASRGIRVIPDYAGTWTGSWAVVPGGCTVTGDFRSDWCAGVQGTYPATLNLQQIKDAVSGTWTLQDGNGNVTGTVATNGALTLTGSSLQSGVTIEISAWQSNTADNRTMSGTFTLTWRATGRSGSAQTLVEMRNFTKQ
jgi:hypothetical protein